MKILWAIGAALALGDCGGSVAAVSDSGATLRFPSGGTGAFGADGADAGDMSTVGVGPIDANGEPSTLVMTCDGSVPTVSLKLPCLLGRNLNGTTAAGYHVLECQLSVAADVPSPPDVAISLMVPLVHLPMLLNQAVSLPFDGIAGPPPVGGGSEILGYPGERFSGSLMGTAIFSEVDPVGRAFIGRLKQAKVEWKGDRGDSFSCTVFDGPFWAVPGDFL